MHKRSRPHTGNPPDPGTAQRSNGWSGSRAEAVMFGRAEPPIFLDRRMAAGVVNGDHDVTGILLGADADKRRAVCTFPTGVEGIFQKIAEDRAELRLTQRREGGSWMRTEKSTDALRASSP